MVSVILSGGENRRFPFLKSFIDVEGKRLIERTVSLFRDITGEVVVSTNAPELYFYLGVPLVGDLVPSSGPLAGIVSAFLATGAGEVFVAACDMPFIKPGLVKYIIDKRNGQATVPLWKGRPEPLLAVYDRSALQTMQEELGRGQRSLRAMLEKLDVRYLDEEGTGKVDPQGESFLNINTPEDHERAFGRRLTAPSKEV